MFLKHNPLRKFFIFALLAALSFSSAAFAAETDPKTDNIRGVERPESNTLDPALNFFSWVLYIPRQITDVTLYAAGRSAEFLSDKEFIERVKDILYLYKRDLLWFPIVGFHSGFRPVYGAGLYYKEKGYRALLRGTMYDAHYWSGSFKNSYTHDIGWGVWKSSLLGVLENKNDRRFYGIGADPKNDPRNTFLADNDYGVYTENRRKLQWSTGVSNPSETYGVTYLGSVQRRAFRPEGTGHNDLRDIMDVSRIPGFSDPVSTLYNELSFVVDTRKQKRMLSPGFYGEIYGGFSNGIGGHDSDLIRYGFNAAGFIPVIKKDRLLVPRIFVDQVDRLDNVAIPFSEYPRQQHFRGVSSREILRSERVTVVPSIEYQWPISHMFAGHIFFDLLTVGPHYGNLQWDHSLWAAGAGIDLNLANREIGRLELAGGSEGFQATVTLGKPLKTNHRKDW